MKFHIIILSLFFANLLHSQSEKFKIEVDYSRFFFNDTSGYFELYYSFYQDQMKKQLVDGKSIEKGILEIQIIDLKSNAYLVNRNWAFSRELTEETSNTEQKSLTGVLGFQLPFGNYKCIAIGKDYFDLNHQDSISFDFEIEKFSADRFAISDLQLASQIRQFEEPSNSIFYKNTYE
ncbi:MAG: hypothetical protein N3A61_05695, partial [Ignavibacteria bacterium]|nr:hypothetical protein [Ignavibacteria bacterium]